MTRNLYVPTRSCMRRIIFAWMTVIGMLMTACSGAQQPKTYTIGVVNYTASLEPIYTSFKGKMAGLGYVEGQNVTYIYHGPTATDAQSVEQEVKSVLDQKADLLVTLGTLPALKAKQAVAGTDIPVIFAPVVNPVEAGIVPSIDHPGGNLTGIQNGFITSKALEQLHQIVPQAKKIHVLYNAKDQVALTTIKPLPDVAVALGIELIPDGVQSLDEALTVIQAMPNDTALFLVPSASLPPDSLIAAATQRGIAIGSTNTGLLQAGVLVTYAASFDAIGEQAAQMADQIFKGAKPADLPVETAEFFLGINLKAAKAINLNIPDAILAQAKTIVR